LEKIGSKAKSSTKKKRGEEKFLRRRSNQKRGAGSFVHRHKEKRETKVNKLAAGRAKSGRKRGMLKEKISSKVAEVNSVQNKKDGGEKPNQRYNKAEKPDESASCKKSEGETC